MGGDEDEQEEKSRTGKATIKKGNWNIQTKIKKGTLFASFLFYFRSLKRYCEESR